MQELIFEKDNPLLCGCSLDGFMEGRHHLTICHDHYGKLLGGQVQVVIHIHEAVMVTGYPVIRENV